MQNNLVSTPWRKSKIEKSKEMTLKESITIKANIECLLK